MRLYRNVQPMVGCGIFITLLFIGAECVADSGTPWIPVKNNFGLKFDGPEITLNSGYLTMGMVHARLYHDASWWTKLISGKRQAIVTIEFKADYPSGAVVEDKRISRPVAIKKSTKPIDIPWSQYLVKNLPTTFSSIHVRVNVGTAAVDELDKTLTIVSDVSSKIPGITVAQAALGAVSAAKTIADTLFDKSLVDNQVESTGELLTSSQTKPGFYVVLAGETAESYSKYINRMKDLIWDGVVLRLANEPIEDVSYFIMRLDYSPMLYPIKDMNVLSNAKTPWASLYIKADEEASRLNGLNGSAIVEEIHNFVHDARTLLNADPTITYNEKEEIETAILGKLQKKLVDRAQRYPEAYPVPAERNLDPFNWIPKNLLLHIPNREQVG